VLNVSTEGPHATLLFRCRIGHRYSADEVLFGKEHLIEEHTWAAVTALSELAVFLRELVASGRAGPRGPVLEERARRADEQQQQLRRFIEQNEPIDLDHEGTADEGVK
jgi:hypothetical protein